MDGDSPVVPTRDSNLQVGVTYAGRTSDIGDEPISTLLPCGNMGGFRIKGSVDDETVRFVSLVTTFGEIDWPDRLESDTGRFVYYGDNRKPGCDLHATPRHGNELLKWAFAAIHMTDRRRVDVPPFFVFSKAGEFRAVRFHGVAVPGAPSCAESEDLVATWTTRGNDRFQNYRAIFTLLDIPTVERGWIEDVCRDERNGSTAPPAWRDWVEHGHYAVLPPLETGTGEN